jgi:tetratricopeptide (TPR) repeat protein
VWFYWLTTGSGREAAGWARGYLDSGRERLSAIDRLPGDFGTTEILRFTGDPDRAANLKRELVEVGRSNPDADIHGSRIARAMAATLSDLAYMAIDAGETEQARAYAEEALALRRELGHPSGIAHALAAVAAIAYNERDFLRASELLAESLAGFETAGAHGDVLLNLLGIAECELLLGRPDETATVVRRVIPELSSIGDRMAELYALRVTGMLAQARGDGESCAMLFGAADQRQDESGMMYFGSLEDEIHREYLERARHQLDDATFRSAYERGAALTKRLHLSSPSPSVEISLAWACRSRVGQTPEWWSGTRISRSGPRVLVVLERSGRMREQRLCLPSAERVCANVP